MSLAEGRAELGDLRASGMEHRIAQQAHGADDAGGTGDGALSHGGKSTTGEYMRRSAATRGRRGQGPGRYWIGWGRPTQGGQGTMAGNTEPLSPRAKLAVTAGKAAAAVSRAAGRGSGSVIGGKVALRLDPDLLGALAQHLDVVLVSATNGKTTTTRLIAEALRASGPVVSNALGANIAGGHHLGTGGRLGRQVRRHRGRREVPGRSGPGRHPQGDRPAEPLARPAGPRRRDPHARGEVARGPLGLEGGHRRELRRPADRLVGLLVPERGVGRGRPGVEGRRLVVPLLRWRDAAPGRRLVLRRVRIPPPHPQLGALRRPRARPARQRLADPPPAARPRQQGERRHLGRRGRGLRRPAAGGPGADVPGAGRGRAATTW